MAVKLTILGDAQSGKRVVPTLEDVFDILKTGYFTKTQVQDKIDELVSPYSGSYFFGLTKSATLSQLFIQDGDYSPQTLAQAAGILDPSERISIFDFASGEAQQPRYGYFTALAGDRSWDQTFYSILEEGAVRPKNGTEVGITSFFVDIDQDQGQNRTPGRAIWSDAQSRWDIYQDAQLIIDNDTIVTNDEGKIVVALNLHNAAPAASVTQYHMSYTELVASLEPSMAAYVYVKAEGAVPADIESYLQVLQNSISPTSSQLAAALEHTEDIQEIVAKFGDFTGTSDQSNQQYSLVGLVQSQLSARWGITNSDSFENVFGDAAAGAVGLGFKSRLYSPTSVTLGLDNQAGKEGSPSESISALAGGIYAHSTGLASFTYGEGDKPNSRPLVNSGEASVVFGKVAGQSVSSIADAGDKQSFTSFKGYLAQAGVITSQQASDNDYTWYWDGNHSDAPNNFCFGGYIHGGAGTGNFVLQNSVVAEGSGNNVLLGFWSVADSRNNFMGPGVCNQIHNSAANFVGGGYNTITARASNGGFDSNAVFNSNNNIVDSARTAVFGSENSVGIQVGALVAGRGLSLRSNSLDWNAAGKARLGRYNLADDSALFAIGNGTSDNARSDAFSISPDGKAQSTYTGKYSLEDADNLLVRLKDLSVAGQGLVASTSDIDSLFEEVSA